MITAQISYRQEVREKGGERKGREIERGRRESEREGGRERERERRERLRREGERLREGGEKEKLREGEVRETEREIEGWRKSYFTHCLSVHLCVCIPAHALLSLFRLFFLSLFLSLSLDYIQPHPSPSPDSDDEDDNNSSNMISPTSPLFQSLQSCLEHLQIPRKTITYKEMLGEGAFGDVYHGIVTELPGQQHEQPSSVAVKQLRCECNWRFSTGCVSLTTRGSGGTAHTCSGRHSQG